MQHIDPRKFPGNESGFTILELLLFGLIFSLIIGTFITVLIIVTTIQVRQAAGSDVAQQGEFLVQQMQYYIQAARIIDLPQDISTSTLTLREATTSFDPTKFTLSGGTVYIQQGLNASLQPLTSKKVTVSNLTFVRHFNLNSSSSAYGTDSVSYSFTVSATGPNQSQYAQTFQSSAAVLVPVGKIALIQQTKFETNSASNVSSISLAYPTPNETSSLLIAYFEETGLVSSTFSDTASNTWSLVGTQVNDANVIGSMYMALNAKAGINTTTVTFTSGATYASLFIFEYRGASTSSALDTIAANISYTTSTPVSPSVSPTSTAELILNIAYDETTAEVPVPGSGFTMQSSSTFNPRIYMADKNQYITGPVNASWQYTGTPNTAVVVATFK